MTAGSLLGIQADFFLRRYVFTPMRFYVSTIPSVGRAESQGSLDPPKWQPPAPA